MSLLAHTLGLAGLLFLAVPAGAGQDDDFAAAGAIFHKAQAGDSGATDAAVTRFERLSAASPDQPLYRAYLGAAQTLQGRDAWMPWTQLRATERGLATLDQALRQLEPRHEASGPRQTPVALETRLVAAATFIALPDLFHRFDEAKAILRAAFASPAFAAAPPALRAGFHRQAALAAARDKDRPQAAAHWRQALAIDPAGALAADARQHLRESGS